MSLHYILDTNIFVSAHRNTYPFDLAPTFWDFLLKLFESGKVALVDQVYSEIIYNADELADWVTNNITSGMILKSDNEDVIAAYTKIITKVQNNPQYTATAKIEFASCADSWIIAHALATNTTIVTEELMQKGAKRRVLIPNVCHEFGVSYIRSTDFLRANGLRM